MFERLFQAAMGLGARILFIGSLVMFLWGVAYIVYILSNAGMDGPSLARQRDWVGAILTMLPGYFTAAAYVFAAALVANHLDRWATNRIAAES